MLLQHTSKLLQWSQCSGDHHYSKPLPIPIKSRTCCKISRRDMAISTSSSILFLSASSSAEEQSPAEFAAANPNSQAEAVSSCIEAGSPPSGKRAFLDVSIDGNPAGRIILSVYDTAAPAGASRFIDLVTGRSGVSYRRKEFVKIMSGYVQHAGIRSYGVDSEIAEKSGGGLSRTDALEREWAEAKSRCPGPRNSRGSLSMVVRNPNRPPPKTKLVARGGKLQIDEEEVGVVPNGTEFVICSRDSPELDESALVVGRVVEGMEVVERIGQVKTVQENTSSPYFRVAKLIGDKRATVAERGFNRPYSKVIVTSCGMLD